MRPPSRCVCVDTGVSRNTLFAACEAIREQDLERAERLCRVALLREHVFPHEPSPGARLSPHEIFSRWLHDRKPVLEVSLACFVFCVDY